MVIVLPKKVILQKDYAILNLGFRFLIYPLNTSFIRNLDPSFMDKWIRAGWATDNTVLLELNHMTIPTSGYPDRSPASAIFSGVVCAWDANKYLRFVAFSKNYFRNISPVNLKIDCWHEQRHVRSYEEYMYDGSLPPSEDDVVEEEVKHVYETLGEEGVKTRSDHALASIEKYKDADAVPGHVVQVWLREFFESRIANYRSQTNQIPQNEYTSRMKEANDKMSVVVANAYEKMLQIDPKTIFKYSLKR
ncbi:MAG: hypothetical protein WED04_08410 [Promethearchaeati archaeon SRVP18_Atabeyarchaeia-1]